MAGRRVDIDLELPRDPDAATVARRELRRRFAGMLHQGVLGDIYLVVSELVTNAVIHGQGEIRLRLEHDAGDVRGEVIDAGSGFEYELREVGPFATSGRGLLIVDRLTTRWGIHEGTTHVWFEILTRSRDRQGTGPLVGEESRPPAAPAASSARRVGARADAVTGVEERQTRRPRFDPPARPARGPRRRPEKA